MPELDRRSMMYLSGLGLLSAAVPLPKAGAAPTYVFEDNFDGPAGSAPDGSKWMIAKARETMQDPTFWELPENVGQYRDDRRNVYVDGKSNLVIKAFKEGNTYYGGKINTKWEGTIGHTFEARIKFECLTPGAWPAFWLSSDANGEIDVIEWYGNGKWANGTTVHALANGSEFATQDVAVDSAWHTWRVKWDESGMSFWQDYTEGAAPYFTVPANSLADWPFNNPGYKVYPILNLAVAGSGGGDPSGGTYPVQMLVDWIRVW
jgi:beta-glucanase (GH16 family)